MGEVMVDEAQLTEVLAEFARTLLTDYPIQGILDHLVCRIVQVLPISAAGVTLISAGTMPRYVAASDASALRYERLQAELDEGPCLTAYRTGEAVAVPDVAADDRFVRFSRAAVAAGLGAVFTFPLRHGDGRLGALDLYRSTAGPLDAQDMRAAQTLADVVSAYLLNAAARDAARVVADVLHHGALHDQLTGLPNRRLLHERLAHAAERATRTHSNAAILFADLDGFKKINDVHGHLVGDQVLRAVAQRLARVMRSGDTLARFAGDEFVFLCEDLHGLADVETLVRRIEDAFARPFPIADGDASVSLSASVGVAFAGPGVAVSADLVERADHAMYRVKRAGGAGHEIVDMAGAHGTSELWPLASDLRSALLRGELDVAYQPIVRLADGLVTGVEALLRWTHPDHGVVSPSVIVAIAEHTDLIGEIGAWLLHRSCLDHGRWTRSRSGERQLQLAVNVSARQLASPGFDHMVAAVLASTGMDPAALVLEMTENVLIEDSEQTMAVLTALGSRGIRLALDDFGVGYSSLSYLRHLPIHIVKIDRGFTADLDERSAGRAIVAAITHLAHILGLTVVVEGVETLQQHDDVRAIGCDAGQGYYYARPIGAAEVSERVGARGSHRLWRLPSG